MSCLNVMIAAMIVMHHESICCMSLAGSQQKQLPRHRYDAGASDALMPGGQPGSMSHHNDNSEQECAPVFCAAAA